VRQDYVCEMVDSSRVDVVCLQETKMQSISIHTILSLLGSDFSTYICLPSVGASGGILVAWRRHVRVSGQKRQDTHSVSVQFCSE
jgi:exonuclease III